MGFVPIAGLLDVESDGPCAVPRARPSELAGGAAGGAVGRIDHVFVYMPRVGPDGWERAVDRVRAQRVYLIPNLNGQRSLWVQATDLQGTLALSHRSEEHTSELQSLMRISYAVFCLKKKKNKI